MPTTRLKLAYNMRSCVISDINRLCAVLTGTCTNRDRVSFRRSVHALNSKWPAQDKSLTKEHG
jgi:hypothetical protein